MLEKLSQEGALVYTVRTPEEIASQNALIQATDELFAQVHSVTDSAKKEAAYVNIFKNLKQVYLAHPIFNNITTAEDIKTFAKAYNTPSDIAKPTSITLLNLESADAIKELINIKFIDRIYLNADKCDKPALNALKITNRDSIAAFSAENGNIPLQRNAAIADRENKHGGYDVSPVKGAYL